VRVEIRAATPDDLPALLQIEADSFAAPRWTARDFMADECVVAEIEGQIAGLLVAREIFRGAERTPPEREILNLAVAPRCRRMGVATALLQNELKNCATHFLEVRESNMAARELYRKFGFVEIGRRSNYYQAPPERAIVMKMKQC